MFVDTGSYLLKGANTVPTATLCKNHSSGSRKLEKRWSDSTLSVDRYWLITLGHTLDASEPEVVGHGALSSYWRPLLFLPSNEVRFHHTLLDFPQAQL